MPSNQPPDGPTDELIARGLAEYFHHVGLPQPLLKERCQHVTRATMEQFILTGDRVQILMVRSLPCGEELREAVLAAAGLPDEGEAYSY